MFDFFKHPKVTTTVETKKEPPKSGAKTTAEIIQEIHDTFYSEVDELLKQAGITLSLETQHSEIIEKYERLQKLGFINTKEGKIAIEEKNRLEALRKENLSKKELSDAIHYFSNKYPLYKFITEESVNRICFKYNLVYGPVSLYTGTVPDKNLKQIESFKIKIEDRAFCVEHEKVRYEKDTTSKWSTTRVKYIEKEFFSNSNFKYGWYMSAVKDHRFQHHDNKGYEAPLIIAAPRKDFDMTNHEMNGFQIVTKKVEIPDPVVLQPVMYNEKMYYLIVTAWGDEAYDSDVMNPKMN